MANKSKDSGTRFESAIVNWLVENGYPDARRNVLGGKFDPADVDPVPGGTPPIIISAKWGYGTKCSKCNRRPETHPETELFGKWWEELQATRARRNSYALALLCHHRPGKGSPAGAHWYVDANQCVPEFDTVGLVKAFDIGLIKVTGAQALTLMHRYAAPEAPHGVASDADLRQ